jgi:hypothetical protein
MISIFAWWTFHFYVETFQQHLHMEYNYLLKEHHLYSGRWNERIGLASFRFSWEAPVWSLSHMNKGTSRQEEDDNLYPYVCRVCWKTRPSNSKCVVNQKHEHVDDISFRELFSRIRLFFLKQRYIGGSAKCSTKPLSKLSTYILSAVKMKLQSYCDTSYSRYGGNQMWILKNSNDLLEYILYRFLFSCLVESDCFFTQ